MKPEVRLKDGSGLWAAVRPTITALTRPGAGVNRVCLRVFVEMRSRRRHKVVNSLTPGTYYFTVAAVNSSGTESPLSSEVLAVN